jgi:hypothetical protein
MYRIYVMFHTTESLTLFKVLVNLNPAHSGVSEGHRRPVNGRAEAIVVVWP